MPTIKQLIRNTRQPIRNVTKSPALGGCPQRRGTCTRVYEISHCSRNPRCCRSKGSSTRAIFRDPPYNMGSKSQNK
uniref:ribosomal protein S12 n=1 Tax=Euphorbia thymifolia TaxID=318061 RepID=UPI0020006FCC|nr:ribosomal protein S12 [Euphorbia thymifolia]UNS16360.1 ribosomal protein S12 [Euphorbia thymifolia]